MSFKIERRLVDGPDDVCFYVYQWEDRTFWERIALGPPRWRIVRVFQDEHDARKFVKYAAKYPQVTNDWYFDDEGREANAW